MSFQEGIAIVAVAASDTHAKFRNFSIMVNIAQNKKETKLTRMLRTHAD